MATVKKTPPAKKGFFSRVSNLTKTAVSLPIIAAAVHGITAVGKEIVVDELKKHLGGTDEAAKDPGDENLFGLVLNTLLPSEKLEAKNFERELRRRNPKQAEAFVLWTAKTVEKFGKQVKKTTSPDKGLPGPKEEASYIDLTDGCTEAGIFILDVLAITGSSTEDTFQERVKYLQESNVFSLISEKKPTIVGEAIIAVKTDAKDASVKATDGINQLTAWIKSKHR